MRRTRSVTLAILLIAVVALSACTSALPEAAASLGNLGESVSSRLLGQPAAAQPAPAPAPAPANTLQTATVADLQAALERVYEQVNPSVVNIRVTMQARVGNLPQGQWPFGQGSPDDETPGFRIPEASAEGSGFVWDEQGHIVTNNHVVDGATQITVTFYDGVSVSAELVGRDADSDLAVIKVDPKGLSLKPVTLGDSTQVKPGRLVVAIGNPFGLQGSMTFGIVSALGRSLPTSSGMVSSGATYTIPDVIQTDAPVNPGNSGGVLLDLEGNLIGVPTAIESTQGDSAGVGFAVPSVIVRKVVPVLIEKGAFEHPYIGISGATLTSQLAEAMDLPASQRGVLVATVTAGSPADKAGLRGSSKQVEIDGNQVQVGGDVITAIDGQPVNDFEDLTAYLARWGNVGQEVELTVLREGRETALRLTLAARPSSEARAETRESRPETSGRTAWLGIYGLTLTPELAQAMDLAEDQTGALIQSVTKGSPAEEAGLQGGAKTYRTQDGRRVMIGGDVIIAVDGKKVTTMEELAAAIQARQPGDVVVLMLLRDGEQTKVEVTLAARPATAD